jgi:hypothetical protein
MMKTSKVKGIAKTEAKKVVKGHEVSMHGAKKMAAGGKTNEMMMSMGRNMAKVANQRGK